MKCKRYHAWILCVLCDFGETQNPNQDSIANGTIICKKKHGIKVYSDFVFIGDICMVSMNVWKRKWIIFVHILLFPNQFSLYFFLVVFIWSIMELLEACENTRLENEMGINGCFLLQNCFVYCVIVCRQLTKILLHFSSLSLSPSLSHSFSFTHNSTDSNKHGLPLLSKSSGAYFIWRFLRNSMDR